MKNCKRRFFLNILFQEKKDYVEHLYLGDAETAYHSNMWWIFNQHGYTKENIIFVFKVFIIFIFFMLSVYSIFVWKWIGYQKNEEKVSCLFSYTELKKYPEIYAINFPFYCRKLKMNDKDDDDDKLCIHKKLNELEEKIETIYTKEKVLCAFHFGEWENVCVSKHPEHKRMINMYTKPDFNSQKEKKKEKTSFFPHMNPILIERYTKTLLQYKNENGKIMEPIIVEGEYARLFQHISELANQGLTIYNNNN